MFKRKYVKISSEKVTQKIEDFLQQEGWNERLEPIELYAFRYALGSMKININNPSIIERIRLNDIPSIFKSSKFIIFSGNDNYGVKSYDDILDVCSNLDQRMIFLKFSFDEKYIEQIYIYLPASEDSMLLINGIYFNNDNSRIDNHEFCFIYDLSQHYENLIAYCVQDGNIVELNKLKYEKEYFVFTNFNIEKSTITFHYVP